MTAGNDVFKAILADTSPFIVKGGWFPSNKSQPSIVPWTTGYRKVTPY